MDTVTPAYLRPKHVKLRYGVSVATVYRWLKQGRITGIHKNGITLISVASLERYLATWTPKGGRP